MELCQQSKEHVTLAVTKFSNAGACDKQEDEQDLHDKDNLIAHSN